MRQIKYIIAVVLFFLGFVASSERFVYHLAHFEETFWQINFEYSLYGDKDEAEKVKSNLRRTIGEYGFDVYCIDTEYPSDYQMSRTIYGTSGALEDLAQRGVKPYKYKSLFCGEVEIVFKEFDEIEDIFEKNVFYVVGPIASAAAFKNATDVGASVYRVEDINDTSGSDAGLYMTLGIIWGIVFAIILLLTIYQAIVSKKEVTVRFLLGESPYACWGKNVLIDSLVYTISFGAIFVFYSSFSPVRYKHSFLIAMFFVMLFISAGILFLDTRISIKKDLSKSLENRLVLLMSYVVKAVSVLVTCSVLSANIVLITEALSYYEQEDTFNQLEDFGYYYLSYTVEAVQAAGKNMADNAELWYRFNECFGENAIWMVDVSEYYRQDAVLLNKAGMEIMHQYFEESLIERLIGAVEGKVCVLFPETCPEDDRNYALEISKAAFLRDASEDVLLIDDYTERVKVLGINRKANVYGSRFMRDPIIILDTRDYKEYGRYRNVMYTGQEALFKMGADVQGFLMENNIPPQSCITRVTNAQEQYQYNKTTISKSAKLLMGISFFVFLLEILMISFLINLEYTINGVEIAIKKTLGYSCIVRVEKILRISAAGTVLATCALLGVSQFLRFGNGEAIIICGVVFSAIEVGFIVLKSIHIDRRRVAIILKGAQP